MGRCGRTTVLAELGRADRAARTGVTLRPHRRAGALWETAVRGVRAGAVITAVTTAMFDANMARAEDLDAGKTGPKLFATNCTSCHRTPKGLAKRKGWFLAGFLQVHYTASRASASELAAYLTSLDHPAANGPPRGVPPRRSPAPAERRREQMPRPPVALGKPP